MASTGKRLIDGIRLAAQEFLPLITFYALYKSVGTKPAIAAMLVVTAASVLLKRHRRQKIGGFFLFSAILSLVFGVVDLTLAQSVLFKYEAAVTNAFLGVYFGATLFTAKPLIQEFAERELAPGETLDDERLYYIRLLTGVWTLYFFTKAAFYAWTASAGSFEELLVVRLLFGNFSFLILIFGERLFRKPLFRAACRLRGNALVSPE